MIKPITTPGKTYSVHTMKGCTIIEPDGWQKTIEAPDGYFDAHFGSVVIEGDDEASIKQVFKLAPYQRLRLLGVVGGGVPAWKLKYAACVDAKAVYEADPDINLWTGTSKEGGRGYQFFDVVRSDGSIPFSFDSLKSIVPLSGGYAHNMFDYLVMQRGVKKLHLKLPIVTEWVGINRLEEINLDAPNLIRFTENYSSTLKRLKVNSLKIISLTNAAWNSPIESIEGEFPVLQSGKISVNNGILDKASVLRICNTVPTWTTGTHELWLGIHIDHQTDEEVLAAIANAESKGWTLTVQWNGTPTAQAATTYGLRKPLIYAKVDEMERTDNTVERVLDWGHYVTDPTGYEEFRSVEAAREYFGLPEETLTETE